MHKSVRNDKTTLWSNPRSNAELSQHLHPGKEIGICIVVERSVDELVVHAVALEKLTCEHFRNHDFAGSVSRIMKKAQYEIHTFNTDDTISASMTMTAF